MIFLLVLYLFLFSVIFILYFDQIVDVTSKLEVKKKDIEKLQEREKALHQQFLASLGENNKFGDYLTKVFKKRIKRSKKKATEGDGEFNVFCVRNKLVDISKEK